jgi:ParB family chromosome partitioning protein
MSDIVQEIMSDRISEPEFAMRGELNRDALFELAADIKKNGLINPITVRPKNGGYEVVAGHRRFNAMKINGMIRIPCVVRELNDKQVFEIMTAENLERADVDPVDEAEHLARHIELTGETPAEVAKSIRRSLSYVESRLAVGKMPDYLKAYLKSGEIKLGVALALSQIENERIRERWTHLAVEQGTSVSQAEFQLQDYRTNKTMYDGIITEATETDNLPTPKMITFRCALTGDEYDIRLCKYVPIYEGNLPVFNEIVSALRSDPAKTE